MGRLTNVKGLRLGFLESWDFNISTYSNKLSKLQNFEKYIMSLCNDFSYKNHYSDLFSFIVPKVKAHMLLDHFVIKVDIYDSNFLESDNSVLDQRLLETRLLFLESFILKSCTKISSMPVKVEFVFLKKDQISASLLSKYLEIKFNQGFSLMDIVSPLKNILRTTRGLKGYRLDFSGRFTRRQRASFLSFKEGRVPFSTLSSKIDYSENSVVLKYGKCGFKVWLNKSL